MTVDCVGRGRVGGGGGMFGIVELTLQPVECAEEPRGEAQQRPALSEPSARSSLNSNSSVSSNRNLTSRHNGENKRFNPEDSHDVMESSWKKTADSRQGGLWRAHR